MDPVELLLCTYDDEDGVWHVWFPHPLGGMNVLESFDNEADAMAFWAKEISDADYSGE